MRNAQNTAGQSIDIAADNRLKGTDFRT
jgi:hypothetical protein